ncbi:MAG: ATP phosphoribosyltransferase [Bacillota bacterium]
MKPITFALAKGRLADQTADLLEKCGIGCADLRADSRRLIIEDEKNGYRFLLVKPSDVPTYVEYGVADLGVAGKDSIMEANFPLYEMLDLKVGKCKLSIAGFPDAREKQVTSAVKRVATKYPNIARRYYQSQGETIEVIKLNGSVELGPLLNLSDEILDIVESGRTLKENGLVVLKDIFEISARVVVNRVSLKTKGERINAVIDALRAQVEGNA